MAFVYSPPAPRSDTRAFDKFLDLPLEIQRLIWDAASAAITSSFVAPRAVRLDLVLLSPHIGLLHTCTEARSVFFRDYRYDSGLNENLEELCKGYFRRQAFLFIGGERSICRKIKGGIEMERWSWTRDTRRGVTLVLKRLFVRLD